MMDIQLITHNLGALTEMVRAMLLALFASQKDAKTKTLYAYPNKVTKYLLTVLNLIAALWI